MACFQALYNVFDPPPVFQRTAGGSHAWRSLIPERRVGSLTTPQWRPTRRFLAPGVFSACLLVAASAFSTACGQPPEPSPSPDDFAILAWGWTPGDTAKLQDIKACGFNLAGFVAPDDVPAVAAVGLKCIVSDAGMAVGDDAVAIPDEEVRQRVAAVTSRLKNDPAVWGYYLRDEPSAALFPTIGKFAAAIRETAPGQRPYVNLFPSLAEPHQLAASDYTEYVEKLIEIVQPPFVSYDRYALMDDGSLHDGYFQNLETVRAISLAHNLPFWNIVQSNAHFRYAEPSEKGLRFLASTTLAYGARGIGYFTYFTPAIGNYRLAPIDQFGNKTPTWEMLRRVNLQIHKLAPTYIKLRSVNVFHHPDVPHDCRGIASAHVVASVEGGQFLVGEFVGPENRPYAMVVNTSLDHSVRLVAKFKTEKPLLFVNPYTGTLDSFGGEHEWLAPGQGALLTVRE